MGHNHFNGKDAMAHLAEKQADGMLNAKEVHGLEIPGYLQAAFDAARDTAASLLLLFSLLIHFDLGALALAKMLALYALGFIIWKTGRAIWLAWARLERLHRILAQEKWEIEHNRPQEREELVALYGMKGFEGKLLEDVVDVLMADESRLLKVMIEEEMGLSLENTEHPLKQGFGAFFGSFVTAGLCIIAISLNLNWGLVVISLGVIGVVSWLTAYKADNRPLSAMIWGLGVAILAWCTTYFVSDYL